ncbi:hypothetical protein ACHWQZ_G002504 [Mnemiopsis leidyi]
MGDKNQVFTQIQALLQQAGVEADAIKQEMVEHFALVTEPAASAQNTGATATAQLTEAISKLKVSQSTKIPKYVKTDSFSRYCERFQEYVLISRMESPNLHMYFLQNVDDETYSQLRDVELSAQQKANADQFCEVFKTAIYGDVSISLKNEVMECRQKADEDIAKYAYRLREKAIVAYNTPASADENCFIAFLRGVKDTSIRRKLNEATSLTSFKEAVKLAKRLEKVNEIIGEENEPFNNIKEPHVIRKASCFYDASMDIPRLPSAEPVEVTREKGTNFTSKLFKAVLKVFQIKDKPGTSFHSQTQGKIESQNRRLNMCFRACLSDKDFKNYDLYAKYITFVLNSLKSVRTGYSAYFLVHGHEPVMPRDMFIQDNRLEKLQQGEVSTAESTAYELYRLMRDTARRVIIKTKQRAQYMATQYDKKVKGPFFEKGEYCLVLVNVPKHKFSEKWRGPYLITDKINDWNYIISIEGQKKIINIEKMKPYEVNKYSTLPKPSSLKKVEKPISSDIKPEQPASNSDSSSDDEFFITFSDNENNAKLDSSNNSLSPSISESPKLGSNEPSPSHPNSLENLNEQAEAATLESPTSTNNLDTTISSNNQENSLGNSIPDHDALASPNVTSSSSENSNVPGPSTMARSDDEDDQEAFFDANSSLDHQNTPASARDVTMSEIDKHGKRKGIRIPLPTGELSRTSAVEDLSDQSSSSHRSGTRYSLRPRVTGVKRYGSGMKSPVKALKKKVTKSKNAK